MHNIIFDLDGTIIDSSEGIVASMEYALKGIGVEGVAKSQISALIGDPLEDMFFTLSDNLSGDDIVAGVNLYRNRYAATGFKQADVYEGMCNLLSDLSSKKEVSLFVATSKPTKIAENVLSYFDLHKCFRAIYGSDWKNGRLSKTKILSTLMADYGLAARNSSMIGDRYHDIIAGAKNHVGTFGVSWGYGARKELVSAGADYVVDSPEDFYEIIIG